MNILESIEKLVNTNTHALQQSGEEFIINLNLEKEKAIAAFNCAIYQPDDKLQQYIRLHQYKILKLMETISNSLPDEFFADPPKDNLLMLLYFTLYDLQVHLEKTCAPYLDFRCKIPFIYLLSVRQVFAKELPILRELLSGFGVTELLLKIILAPMEDILQKSNVSYHRVYYIKELCRNFRKLPANSTAGHVEEVLFFMNFNSTSYLKHHLESLSEIIQSFPTIHQQLMQVKWLLKINNQQLVHANLQYSCEYPSLKEQIRDWLTHEAIYMEQKLLYPEHSPLPEEVIRWQSFRVKVDLSVNELGCLLRLMMEHGVILNENKTEIADFFAQFFASKSQASMSGVSLRQKMYNYPPSTAESIRELLIGLFNTSKQLKLET